jgi:hypothetical protein
MRRTRIARASVLLACWSLLCIEIVLAIGFTLRLVGADTSWIPIEWMHQGSEHFARPFRGFFEPIGMGSDGSAGEAVFDTPALLAMFVYGLVALILKATISGPSDLNQRTEVTRP